MTQQGTPALESADLFTSIMADFFQGIIAAIPKILAGLIFLTVAYIGISLILTITRRTFARLYPDKHQLIVNLAVTIISVFLWFGAGLVLLNIVGLSEVAASLGTATGFIGLGVVYALKEMIADTVAGVYLLRDPDFNEGYRVSTAAVEGTVTTIDLRKTRIKTDDGSLVVLANRDVEKKWTTAPSTVSNSS